jgi:hypothetical protein
MRKIILLLPIVYGMFSCTQDETSNPLIGKWAFKTTGGTGNLHEFTHTFVKTDVFDEHNSGIIFMENDQVIENKPIGFCGVPPIIYDKYEGSWKQDGKKIYVNESGVFQKIKECYEIVSVNEKTLVLKYKK